MSCFVLDLSKLKRESTFPYRLWKIYYSKGICLPLNQNDTHKNHFEVCIRLSSQAEMNNDIINGESIHTSYPHAVWKKPLQNTITMDSGARDVIAFIYPPESMEAFQQAGLIPNANYLPFALDTEISFLIDKFYRLINNLYSKGIADQLDWLGFCMIKEVILAATHTDEQQTFEQKIRNIALWLDIHCTDNHDFHSLAKQHNLNYTQFYREWNHYMGITPYQYVINARLKESSILLTQTKMSISRIIETINFSGSYAFFKRFKQK